MNIDKHLNNYISSFSRAQNSVKYYMLEEMPTMQNIEKLVDSFMTLLFPLRCKNFNLDDLVRVKMMDFASILSDTISLSYKSEKHDACLYDVDSIIDDVLSQLGHIRTLAKLDAQAGFDQDPAAISIREIILCYPSIKASSVYRLAHILFLKKVPLIPRMLNEYIHSNTGIDIHPGAEIGKSFFIDHGTGVVIGETTIIKDNVKIYQGVTLGAVSTQKSKYQGVKRHPTIENNVTIYANATILGNITLGEYSIIGSSVYLTEDLEPFSIARLDDIKITISKKKTLY